MDRAEVERFVRERPEELLPPRLRVGDPGAVIDVVPLTASAALAIVESGEELLVVPLADRQGLRRAEPGDGVWRALLGVMTGRVACDGLVARRDREAPNAEFERPIDVDQSNESVIVGGAVVKLFVRTAHGAQPAADLPGHLAAVGFRDMPASIGAVKWASGDALVASASTYLPGSRDGWDWYPEVLAAALGDPRGVSDAVRLAEQIGAVVGRLHGALATPSPILPEPLGQVDASTWHAAASATLEEAIAATDGAEGERLREVAPQAAEAIGQLDGLGATPVMRIHGDLHVGQILRWEGGLVVSDFDGNPLAPLDDRIAPASPARDVAAMARAIDHVGWVVLRRHPGYDDDIARLIGDAQRAFLDAYRASAPEGLFDERLLMPLEVWQEAHEYVYAARYLPRWRYVPDAAMPALLAAIG